ncbi:MAG: hypothetical protein JWR01_226 [Subtercola sp.]|nr:hypothetical protein [Subtercola sp.]
MPETRSRGALILIGTPLAIVAVTFTLVILILSTSTTASASCTGAAGTADPNTVPQAPVAGYSGVQLQNAAYIINAASSLGLDRAGQVIGVMTAMGESGLRVIDYGDTAGPDSRGLFQQRGNGAWSTYQDRMDPTISATNFFTALQKVSGWEQLDPTIAAHRVQGNADPFYYTPYFSPADQVVTALTSNQAGTSGGGCASGTVVLPLSPGFNMTDNYGPRIQPIPGASSWHPADDLQHWPNNCLDQIYSITSGTVTLIAGYQVSIKAPAGYTVSYLHMKLSNVSVHIGDTVTPGEPIALTGSEGPSTGCHLDLRINTQGNTDPEVATLPQSQDLGGPETGWVDPEKFFALYGVTLCPEDSCKREYTD